MPAHVVMDINGVELTTEDKEVLAHPCVLGIILFAHNYESPKQLTQLCADLRKLGCRFIAADQEGGRVQRFKDGFSPIPPMRHWGQRYLQDPDQAVADFIKTTKQMAQELLSCGVNVTFAPVLDLDSGHNEVIGERSFGADPKLVTHLAAVMINAMREMGIPAIGKHFPGHGGTHADSHQELPIDERDWETLCYQDLQPFVELATILPAMMSVHVKFPKIDPMPASVSRFWLKDVLRGKMGFEGMLISDCLSMQAMAGLGSYVERAELALAAGNDVLLICNNRAGVTEVLDATLNQHNPEADLRVGNYIKYLQ